MEFNRNSLKICSSLLLSLVVLFISPFALFAGGESEEELRKKADEIHAKYFTIDTHNDTALFINDPNMPSSLPKGQVTFPLMRKGGMDAALFAIYIGQGKRDRATLDSAINYVKSNLLQFRSYVENYSGGSIAYNSDDLIRNKKNGAISVMLAIENGYGIGTDLKNLEMFRDIGVRAITLCHNSNNDICDSAMDKTGPEHNGLSPFGREVVKEMNRLGILIDLSHASSQTLYDVVELSSTPVFASHSAVHAIKPIKRNLTDDEIKAIASTGGLIQIPASTYFLTTDPKDQTTVSHIADHIDYVKNLVGIEYVGLGTDFDGGGGVTDMFSAAEIKNLTVELLRRGYSERELELFWGGNFIRFLKAQMM